MRDTAIEPHGFALQGGLCVMLFANGASGVEEFSALAAKFAGEVLAMLQASADLPAIAIVF